MDEFQQARDGMAEMVDAFAVMLKAMEKRSEVKTFMDDYGKEHFSYKGVVWCADFMNQNIEKITKVMRDPLMFMLAIDHEGSLEDILNDPLARFLAGLPQKKQDGGE